MGKVVVKIKLTNLSDLFAKRERLTKRRPRQVTAEALVDTGATRLYLKPSIIQQLGLRSQGKVRSHTTNGVRLRRVFDPIRLELMGRRGNFDVVEIDEAVPNLLGQIPLEYLDFVVDSARRRLRPNPEHKNQLMAEEY